jgi:hypothetical protein
MSKEPAFGDGPSQSCLGASCHGSQIWVFRLLLIMPFLYSGWNLLVLIFTAGFGALPVSGLEPFKHEQYILHNGTEANAAIAFSFRIGRNHDGGSEYRPFVAWLCMILTHNLVAPWLVYVGTHDPQRAIDYCILLQIVHLVLTTGVSGDVPRTSEWWLTSATSFLVQSQLSSLLIARLGVGRAVWVRRIARGPFGPPAAMPVAVCTDAPRPFKTAAVAHYSAGLGRDPAAGGELQIMAPLPPLPPRRDIVAGSYDSYVP